MATCYPIGRLRELPSTVSGRDRAILAGVNLWVYLRYPFTVLKHRSRVGTWPSIAFPHNPNECLFWRKVFDHNPSFPSLCDKLQMKEFYRQRCPGIDIPETLWVGDHAEDIPEVALQGSVIVKTTAASAQNYLIRNGVYDRKRLDQTMNRWLAGPNYGVHKGEWGYMPLKSRIMVEKLVLAEDGTMPINVKVFVVGGRPLFLWICRFKSDPEQLVAPKEAGTFGLDGTRIWTHDAAYSQPDQMLPEDYSMPPCCQKAIEYASQAGYDIDYARLDFLCGQESVYAGEVTLYTGAGFDTWKTHDIPSMIQKNWDLRWTWFLKSEQKGWRNLYSGALRRALDRFHG